MMAAPAVGGNTCCQCGGYCRSQPVLSLCLPAAQTRGTVAAFPHAPPVHAVQGECTLRAKAVVLWSSFRGRGASPVMSAQIVCPATLATTAPAVGRLALEFALGARVGGMAVVARWKSAQAACLAHSPVQVQLHAPTVHVAGILSRRRAPTACIALPAGQALHWRRTRQERARVVWQAVGPIRGVRANARCARPGGGLTRLRRQMRPLVRLALLVRGPQARAAQSATFVRLGSRARRALRSPRAHA